MAAASFPVTSPMRRGQERERPLPLGGEEPLGRQLALQPLERGEVVAQAETLEREHAQPEVAAGLVQLGPSVGMHAVAVGEIELQRVELAAGHRDAEARSVLGILEREEDARPAGLTPQLRDLALDPDRRQAAQPRGDPAVERADGVDAAVAVVGRLDLHPFRIRGA